MNNEKKCIGCGILLQSDNLLTPGYTPNLENDYCQRCHRLQNYGEYEKVKIDDDLYGEVINTISRTHDLVLYTADILNIPDNLEEISKSLPNSMILILNKRDLLPKGINDERIVEKLKSKNLGFKDIIIIN